MKQLFILVRWVRFSTYEKIRLKATYLILWTNKVFQVTMSGQWNQILCRDKLKVHRNLLPLSTASLNFLSGKGNAVNNILFKKHIGLKATVPKCIIVRWWYTKKSSLFSIKNYLRWTKTFSRILLVVFNVLGTRTTCNCNTIWFDWWEPGINSHFKLWDYTQ